MRTRAQRMVAGAWILTLFVSAVLTWRALRDSASERRALVSVDHVHATPSSRGSSEGPPEINGQESAAQTGTGKHAELESGIPSVRVVVVQADTEQPVPHAQAVLVRAAATQDGLILDEELLGTSTTDERGLAAFAADAVFEDMLVCVSARGYVPASSPVQEPFDVTRVVLQRGERVGGVVLDRAGTPVGEVTLRATGRRVSCWHTDPRRIVFGLGDALTMATRTDSDGRFEFAGIPSGRPVCIDVLADGWLTDTLFLPGDPYVVQPGEVDARLYVKAVRAFRVKLVDAASGGSVQSSFVSAVPIAGAEVGHPGVQLASVGGRPIWSAHGWLRALDQEGASGFVTDVVCLDPGGSTPPTTLKLSILADGYRATIAEVRLGRPSEVVAGSLVDEVLLRPRLVQLTGSLLIDCSRSQTQFYRPNFRVLSTREGAGGPDPSR